MKVQGFASACSRPWVRLALDKSADDYIEIALDTSGEQPVILGHSRRTRGRSVVESERPIGGPSISEVTEEQLLAFVLEQLGPLVER